MKTIAQFRVYKENKSYIAEAVNLSIVTQGNTLDELIANIKEAVVLYFEGESSKDSVEEPTILVNYELPLCA